MTKHGDRRGQLIGRFSAALITLFIALSVVPVAIYLETRQLNISNFLFGPDIFKLRYVSISLSHAALALAALVLLPAFFLREITRLHATDYVLLFIGMAMTASLIAGAGSGEDGQVSYLAYLKSILFLPAYFIGRSVPPLMLPRLLLVVIFANLVFLLSLLVYGLSSGAYNPTSPLAYTRTISASIFEFRNLYPAIAYASLLLCLLFYRYYGRPVRVFLWLNILLVLWLLSIAWSRSAVLILVQSLVFTGFASLVLQPRLEKLVLTLTLILLAALAIGLIFLIPEAYLPHISILSRLDEGTQSGTDNRFEYMRLGIAKILENPLFGERFIPTFHTSPSGEIYDNPRLFTPHNQYLDFGLRGGLLAMLAIILFHLLFPWRILYAAYKEKEPFIRSFLIFIFAFAAALILGNFGQNYFIQSASAFFIWFFFGIAVTCTDSKMALNQRRLINN